MSLWGRINVIGIGGWGQCLSLEPDAPLDGLFEGAVVLDDEGRIVETLGYWTVGLDELEAWGLGDPRYPCYAGKTVKYRCFPLHD